MGLALPPIYGNNKAGKRHSDIIEIDESQSNEVEDLLLMFKDKGKSLEDAVKSFTDHSKQTQSRYNLEAHSLVPIEQPGAGLMTRDFLRDRLAIFKAPSEEYSSHREFLSGGRRESDSWPVVELRDKQID